MSPVDYLRALTLPLRSAPILLSALLLLLIIGFVVAVSIVSLWAAGALTMIFALMLLPGLTRYLMQIAEWCAHGRRIEPPSADHFDLFGSFWQLSALLILIAYLSGWYWLDARFGRIYGGISMMAFAALYPAMVAALVLTHSLLQAFNPRALILVLVNTGATYLYAPLTVLGLVAAPLSLTVHSRLLAVIAFIYFLFAFFVVIGTMLKSERLTDKVAIPDPLEPDEHTQAAVIERERTSVLNHAYGFLSRGNREGGLQHIYEWLDRDPDPAEGWPWFFEQLLHWENNDPALYFAQRYVSELLAQDLRVPAVKMILRARMINEQFRPSQGDLAHAVDAAKSTGNEALAKALSRH